MSTDYDLIFTGVRARHRQRVDGSLFIVSSGDYYTAVSGARTLFPLPNGLYYAGNLRVRKDLSPKAALAMQRNVPADENDGGGMCFPPWSVNLKPCFPTARTYLRIHPERDHHDGDSAATEGCIGILDHINGCFAEIKRKLAGKPTLLLLVSHTNTDPRCRWPQSLA
jgi:hypothetical protein